MDTLDNSGLLSKLKSRYGLSISKPCTSSYIQTTRLVKDLRLIMKEEKFNNHYSATCYVNDFIETIPTLSEFKIKSLFEDIDNLGRESFLMKMYTADTAGRYASNTTDLFQRKVEAKKKKRRVEKGKEVVVTLIPIADTVKEAFKKLKRQREFNKFKYRNVK